MSERTIEASVSISRNSNDTIRIQIIDELSRIRFVTVELTPHDFAMAVTGLSDIPAKAMVDRLELVGLRKVTEARRTLCPLDTYSRDELRQWLAENCQEPGWNINDHLGSQNSIGRDIETGQIALNYSVYRYEDPK